MPKPSELRSTLWDALTSLKLTIACMAALMVLVVACTLAQVRLGTFGAVDAYMHRWVVWWDVPGSPWSFPIFPGGALVGAVLAVNLFAAQLRRLELAWRKAGLWIVHAGLILLVAGEFVTGLYQVETRMAIQEGASANFVESPRQSELVVVDTTDPASDDVYGVPESLLARAGEIPIPGTPVTLRIHGYYPNAALSMRQASDPPAAATAGVGTSVAVRELPPVSRDEETNAPTALVEPIAGGRSYGTWLVSSLLGAPQGFTHEGRTYQLVVRPRRIYLPYTVTLKKFRHDVYPGTNIPKNFSSLVHLSNPSKGEERDVLIYMNQPLRYEGKAFYQASFGNNDTLSILQVVQNPGWLLPYVSCVLVTLGLLVHFAITLRRSMRRQAATRAAAAAPAAVEAST
ncbi:cytochrome c biogenesis protein ResB [Anaeromyxobacter oryzisoli]|uniref:cytochrome c biogenesis protein ResB n=1 Tax=Anaeromyxobacter oryzisoli TaxID=2925408 RepID=UPI001F57644B|nr:cytochrome c biogenesis protein ResB [Anaeromyxobacter sp. SG63]